MGPALEGDKKRVHFLKGKLGAEQTGHLWAGKEKEQFLEEENKAHRQFYFVRERCSCYY